MNALIFYEPALFCVMLFTHIVDDYYLQGCLASMKQKNWWIEQYNDDLYKNDYIVALLMHGFSWAFLIMLPLAIYHFTPIWVIFVIINAIVHSYIDNLKANKKSINLITDQSLHIFQIGLSLMLYL